MSNILTAFADGIINYLLFASVIAAVLTSLAWGIIKSAKIQAPVYRHQVWLYCLIGVVFLPAICLYGPKLTLAVLPAHTQVVEVAADAEGMVLDVPVVEELSDEIHLPGGAYAETAAEDNLKPQTFTTKNIFAVLWLAGVVLMAARLMVGWYRLRRVCLSAEAVSGNGRLGDRDVRILLTSQVQGPVCFGLFRGIILLPREMYENTAADKLEMILNHELAHIERRDYLANLFQRVIEALFFFHPFLWYASLQLTQQREQICDNYVIAEGASADDYTVLLTQIVERAMRGDRLGAVALIEGRLLSRVRFLLNPNRSKKTKLSIRAVFICTAAILTAFGIFGTVRLEAKADASDSSTSVEAESSAEEKSNFEVLDIKIEPIREGQNVVHINVKNTSTQDQVFATYIQTQSSDGGWGTTFTDIIKAGETRWTQHACKIRGSITNATYIRLQLYNPAPAESFDREQWFSSQPWDKWFKKVKYSGSDLEHFQADQSQTKPASKRQSDAAIKTLRQIQDYIKNKEYEAAWELFTRDFGEAEFQIRGFEWFKECMESPKNFYLSSTELLALEPKSVNRQNDIVALTAVMKDEPWTVNFVEVGGKWKIDSIERIDAAAKKVVDGHAESELEILDVKFEPIRQVKNAVRVKVQNTSDKEQTFGVDIRAEAPIRNWQRQFLDTIKAGETKLKSFDFEILGPITDAISIRLRFYNPPSADEFNINDWFKKIKYTYNDLDELGIVQERSEPASKSQAEAVTTTFKQFQSYLKEENYEATWELLTKHIRSGQFQDDFETFKEQFSDDTAKTIFLNLHPESVTESGKFLTLSAKGENRTWKIHFIEEDGQWKIYEGQEHDRGNWKERVLPKMEKRFTKHFEIYYFEDSTAEREIDQIAEQKERGFREICQFLGKDSDVRICMVFFEDGKTKQLETGHQGAGWAYGHTIVEIYNEEEKLDPYHETVHILMGSHGNPPALFNEGFAVYTSERLGAHGLENLGGGKASLYARVRELKEKGEWIELEELVTYTDIGPSWSRPPISYAEASAFVKFLIDTYGKDKFLQAYRTLKNSSDKTVQQRNIMKLEQIYDKSLQELEKAWERAFRA